MIPRPDHDSFVRDEPHLSKQPARPDPSDQRAEKTLSQNTGQAEEEALAKQSVYDEPDIFPGRPPETITQDWSCGACGYNLRGLPTGHRCPECGHVELYRPPPEGTVSHAAWYRKKRSAVPRVKSWAAVLGTGLLAAVVAVPCIAVTSIPLPITTILLGPPAEEAAKLIFIVLLVELKPYLIRNTRQVYVAAAIGSLGLAFVQNGLLFSFGGAFASPPIWLLFMRWIGISGLHLLGTVYAVSGIASAWKKADAECRPLQLPGCLRPVVIVIVVHAAWNAVMLIGSQPTLIL